MKFFLFILILFTVFIGSNTYSFSPWISYTTLDMEAVNYEYQRSYDDLNNYGVTTDLVKFSNALTFGIDLSMFRIEYMNVSPLKFTYSFIIDYTEELQSSLTMGLIGFKIPDTYESKINIGIYAGGCVASINRIITTKLGTNEQRAEIPYSGSDIIGEFDLEFKILEEPMILNIGYRYAKVAEMKVSKDVDTNNDGTIDYKQGEIFKDRNGNPLIFDYSGIVISIGMKFGSKPKYEFEK